ncbi:HAD domain-containing protein [Klebsiella quasipneumoniae]|uniref:HAD domain-containing protein n=1 Tax=Klebsiella quasipneumoniae TaxID=1463165 RepID=UPI0023E0F05C|nr:HAD domain-containing protein [Klebsiella quasipneumoniae]
MPLLEKILKNFKTMSRITYSSWRQLMTLEGLKYLFPVAFRHRIIGVTPSLQEVKDTEYVRYRECLLHARHMGVNKFIIIDDESHRFPPGCENLVSTNYSEGMTDQTVASVIISTCQYLT